MVYPYKQSDLIWELETVSTAYADQLVSSDNLKKQTRNVPDAAVTIEDAMYTAYAAAAERLASDICGITLRQTTFKLHLSDFPYNRRACSYAISPLFPPIQSITHIKYYDANDVQQTLASTNYEQWINRRQPIVIIKDDNLPALTTERTKRVEMQYVAGYSLATIPPLATLLIQELVAFWYKERELYGRLPSPNEGATYRVTQALIDALSNSLL